MPNISDFSLFSTPQTSLKIIDEQQKDKWLNPIAYGILRLSQLRGWDFYPTPQKTMLKLFH